MAFVGLAIVASTATIGLCVYNQKNELRALQATFRRPKSIPFPSSNPYSKPKFELGKKLFFDKQLSLDHSLSCASCHDPERGWSDGRAKGLGKDHKALTRRVPELWNLAWGQKFFWDGRANSLEEQALGPIQNPAEMALPLPQLVERLKGSDEYSSFFSTAFPGQVVTPDLIAKAIATFERTIVSEKTAFDRWIEGDLGALTDSQRRGFALFTGKANCVQCHTGWNFTNGSFADIGLTTGDKGRGLVLQDSDADFAFKAPSLRHLAKRQFFLHDGSAQSVNALIENYNVGGTIKRFTSQLWLRPLRLTSGEKQDLAQFLESLSVETKEKKRNLWSTLSSSR